jgi:hypothetical protein
MEITQAEPRYKLGDKIKYDSRNEWSVDTGVITEIHEKYYGQKTGYRVTWDKYPSDTLIADGNFHLIERKSEIISIEKAKEQKENLEKDLLALIEKFQTETKLPVGDVKLQKYFATMIGGQRQYFYEVHVEVNL